MVHLTPEDIAFQKAHIKDDRSNDIIVSHAICIAIAFVAVILRFVSRRVGNLKVSWDDYMIVAAFIFALGEVIGGLLAVRYGGAKHAILLKDPETFAKVVIATEVLYNPAIACVKLSCLLLYRRVFPSKRFHIVLYVIGGLIFAYSWIIMITAIFQCSPIKAAWDMTVKNPKCIKFNVEVVFFSGLNAATDLITICLPLPLLWKLQLPLEKRIQLMGLFLAGGFVCIVSIYRIPQEAKLSLSDAPWSDVDACVWSVVEVCVGILSACMPSYRPLFLRVTGSVSNTSYSRKLKEISWPMSRSGKTDQSSSGNGGIMVVHGVDVLSEKHRSSPQGGGHRDGQGTLPLATAWYESGKSKGSVDHEKGVAPDELV